MHLKDYYGILKLSPSATQQEIKKAYRQLALQYHPDKNNNDTYAVSLFTEIKEAYEVLTDPSKKGYYLQQRWYAQSMGKKKTQQTVTPVTILKQVVELERYVARLDVFRMDKQGLHEYIMALIDDSTIEKLNKFNERETNDEIVLLLVQTLKTLPLFYITPLHQQLRKINLNAATHEKLDQYMVTRQKMHKRDKYRIWVIILSVILLCLLIFLAGK